MTILFEGKESTKNVNSKDTKVIPFAGTDCDGEYSSMGVGLIYSQYGKAQIWGLAMPHNIVASYRGMKIAEELSTFDYGTLAACWYAGHKSVHPSDQKYIDDIELMIGANVRQRILQAPLPCFDDAIKLMQEKNIHFQADDLLIEIRQGNLVKTPVLEQAINDYSDEILLFRGLKGNFEKAYQSMTEKPKGLIAKLLGTRISSDDRASAIEYVTMAEKMLPSFIPDLERQYGLLIQNIGSGIDISQFNEDSLSKVEHERSGIYDNKKRFDQAAANLRQTLANSMPPEHKFIAYHTALDNMMRATHNISSGFSTLEIYAGKGEPSGDIFKTSKSLADGTVKVINRSAREQLQGAYALV